MSLKEDNSLSVEEVEKVLTEIENKYSPISQKKHRVGNSLTVLSKEFDSLGLCPIDCSQSINNVFEQVVSGARSLVQIHRGTLSQMKDLNIQNTCKDSRSTELYKTIDIYKLKLTKSEDKNANLRNIIVKCNNDHAEMIKRENALKEELEKTKRYYVSKQNELHHQIKKLNKENSRLKEMLGSDINTNKSKDDIVLKQLKQYKMNEEIYKSTIQKLQENNTTLLHEILDLRDENAAAVGNKQKCTKAS